MEKFTILVTLSLTEVWLDLIFLKVIKDINLKVSGNQLRDDQLIFGTGDVRV